jgi:hypothetical protein
MMWWWTLLSWKVHSTLLSFGASTHSLCGHILCIMYTMMVIPFKALYVYTTASLQYFSQ